MAILLDLSQIAISNLMMSPNIKGNQFDDDLIKHMILNSLRAYKVKFGREYGELIICCDARNVWRYDIFPLYKWERRQKKKDSSIDWSEIFRVINEMKADLREHFPYKVIEVEGAEADDVIATLARNTNGPVLIIGGDKDYAQLQKYANVKQYSPKTKKFVTVDEPLIQLNELVISGDKGDGIPNIKSDSDCFEKGKRQTPIRKTDLARWSRLTPDRFCENRTMLENYNRNRTLIDFEYIPQDLQASIMQATEVIAKGNKMMILTYLAKNRMRNLIKDVDQF